MTADTFFAVCIGLGLYMVFSGVLFNATASKASPEDRERFDKPTGEALKVPEGTPENLRPFRDLRTRGSLFSLGALVTIAKIGPISWRIGAVLMVVGIIGLVVS